MKSGCNNGNEKKLLIFAGTSEGRELSEHLSAQGFCCHVMVATEYGELLQPVSEHLEVHKGRRNAKEMETFMKKEGISMVIDATHPYATEVSKNIKTACECCGCTYLRLLRKTAEVSEQVIRAGSVREAVSYLNQTQGNILFTTGSKDLKTYMEGLKEKERLYARILPNPEILEEARKLGIHPSHMICMQGPFSKELNTAMLKQLQCKWLVTKDTGAAGGFPEKVAAAHEAGAQVLVLDRPEVEQGYSMEEICRQLHTKPPLPRITLLGIGMGTEETLTREGEQAVLEADAILGAKRMLETFSKLDKPKLAMYRKEEIAACIRSHPEWHRIVIALSGDVGFYSGAKGLLEELKDYPVKLVCGISSVVYFASKLQIPWEDITLCSIHGRNENIPGKLRNSQKLIALAGGAENVRALCRELTDYGFTKVQVAIGTNLSYPDEQIKTGTVSDFLEFDTPGLHVIYLTSMEDRQIVTHGRRDALFQRGQAPMTKEEVRSISISKLELTGDAVVYDIGAGTGSVSVECARMAVDGRVYAMEYKEDALELLAENKRRFGTPNVEIIKAKAPEKMETLPAPSHAFIGGSGGNLEQILNCILEKNPSARIVLNAITLETVTQILEFVKKQEVHDLDMVQITVSKAKVMGRYHMMTGQNPVWIISFGGEKPRGEKY